MDPNANLEEQRTLAAKILNGQDVDTPHYTGQHMQRDAARLAELVQALDEWISKGGFLPAPWSQSR